MTGAAAADATMVAAFRAPSFQLTKLDLIGQSPAFRKAAALIERMANCTVSVLLYGETVGAECRTADGDVHAAPGTARALLEHLAPDVQDGTHPRDLSEGQRLALALAIVLAGAPPLVLLDEPTRGLDYGAKTRLVASLRLLAARC